MEKVWKTGAFYSVNLLGDIGDAIQTLNDLKKKLEDQGCRNIKLVQDYDSEPHIEYEELESDEDFLKRKTSLERLVKIQEEKERKEYEKLKAKFEGK